MNSIAFFLETKPNKLVAIDFFLWMLRKGVTVSFMALPISEKLNISEDTLYITDCREAYERLLGMGTVPLVLLYAPEDADKYPDATYFVMDVWKTEFSYFDKIYRRIHDLPVTISRTLRLTIRETVERDVDSFVELYRDEEITRYTEGLYDTDTEKKYISEYRKKVYACQDFGIWTLIENSSGKIIGRAGLSYREGLDGVEIGFLIGKAYQNKGYATEAIRSILKFAKEAELSPVYALVMPENAVSLHVLDRFGFAGDEEITLNGVSYRKLIMTEDRAKSGFRIK